MYIFAFLCVFQSGGLSRTEDHLDWHSVKTTLGSPHALMVSCMLDVTMY